MDAMNAPWHLVLPVKDAARAKTRLVVAEGISRAELARAMALDTIAAALDASNVAEVLVVTSDSVVATEARAAGVRVTADPGSDLDAAVRRGLSLLGRGPAGVLLADLPALTGDELAAALDACSGHDAAFVPDAEGTGTVLLTARQASHVQPAFGDGSAGRHAGTAKRLELDLPRLRRDVDRAEALAAAVGLGVGPRTVRALRGSAQRAGAPSGPGPG